MRWIGTLILAMSLFLFLFNLKRDYVGHDDINLTLLSFIHKFTSYENKFSHYINEGGVGTSFICD